MKSINLSFLLWCKKEGIRGGGRSCLGKSDAI